MPEIAYVNGCFGPIAEARVSIEDRGFQFADGVYEVIVAYGGRLFRLEEHLARLERSCAAIELTFDVAAAGLAGIIHDGLRRCEFLDAMIYVQVTRGAAPRAHVYADGLAPTIVATFKPKPGVPQRLRDVGASIKTIIDPRWANCHVKSIALLPNVLARNAAARAGFDDALFVGDDGEVREATTANIFMIRAGQLLTPPISHRILTGVTRAYVLECAARIGVPAVETRIDVAELPAADELFLTNTTAEIVPVMRVNGAPVGSSSTDGPGPLTRRLQEAFRAGR